MGREEQSRRRRQKRFRPSELEICIQNFSETLTTRKQQGNMPQLRNVRQIALLQSAAGMKHNKS
eukprot:5938828-Pleurochrysis_carterae.AAC.1